MEPLFSKSDLMAQAKSIGAVCFQKKIIENQFKNKVYNNNEFSTHFLDSNGKEICYFIDSFGLYEKQGLIIHKTPKELLTTLTLSNKINL